MQRIETALVTIRYTHVDFFSYSRVWQSLNPVNREIALDRQADRTNHLTPPHTRRVTTEIIPSTGQVFRAALQTLQEMIRFLRE